MASQRWFTFFISDRRLYFGYLAPVLNRLTLTLSASWKAESMDFLSRGWSYRTVLIFATCTALTDGAQWLVPRGSNRVLLAAPSLPQLVYSPESNYCCFLLKNAFVRCMLDLGFSASIRTKDHGFKSTHGCSHTVKKSSISPRLFGQCTLNIYH